MFLPCNLNLSFDLPWFKSNFTEEIKLKYLNRKLTIKTLDDIFLHHSTIVIVDFEHVLVCMY